MHTTGAQFLIENGHRPFVWLVTQGMRQTIPQPKWPRFAQPKMTKEKKQQSISNGLKFKPMFFESLENCGERLLRAYGYSCAVKLKTLHKQNVVLITTDGLS